MTIVTSPPTQLQGLNKQSLFTLTRKALIVVSFAGLIMSNILSLTSEAFHTAAYGFLNSVGSAFEQGLMLKALQNSPTSNLNKKIDIATKNLKAENASLIGRHQRLESEYRALDQKHAQLQTSSLKRVDAVKKFTGRTLLRTVKTTSVELAELPVRVLPYLGIAVTVAATGYSIKSDCEMLQEMNDMVREHDLDELNIKEVCGVKIPTATELWNKTKSNSNMLIRKAYEALEALK